MSKYVVVSAEWLDKTLQFLDCEKERRMADLEKRGVVVPLTPAQERAGEMEALIDSIAVAIHHHLYPAQNEYVRNGRSLAQDIERQIERFTAEQEGEAEPCAGKS